MSSSKDGKFLFFSLSCIGFFADSISIGQFILSGSIFDFWSFRWISGCVIIFGIFLLSIILLFMGGLKKTKYAVEKIYSIICGIGACLLYIYGSCSITLYGSIGKTGGEISFIDFLGFTLMTAALFIWSIFLSADVLKDDEEVNALKNSNKLFNASRYLSYIFLLGVAVFVATIVFKYIFIGPRFVIFNIFVDIFNFASGSFMFTAYHQSGLSMERK